MKRGMQWVCIAGVLVVLAASPALSQTSGDQLFVGARPMGMGGTFVGIADDANTIYWNPAGLAGLQRQEFSFMYSDLYGIDLRNLYGAYVLPISDNNAIGVDMFQIGFDDNELQFGQLKFNASYGYRWRRKLSVGATVKYVFNDTGQDNITLDSGGGIGFDLGVLFAPNEKWRFGVLAQDVSGTSIKHDSGVSEEVFENNLVGGLSYRPVEPLTVGLDIGDRVHFGAEYWIKNLFAVRGGLQRNLSPESGSDFDGDLIYSGGAGLRYRLLQFDYAYETHPVLPATQRFSVSVFINPSFVSIKDATLRPRTIYRSLYNTYQQNDFADVVLKNSAPEPLPVTLSLELPSLLDRPYQEQVVLPPQSISTHSMRVVFPDSVLLTEAARFDRLVQPRVAVSYEQNNAQKTADRSIAPVYVLGRGKISWDDPARVGAFITPDDPAVQNFVTPVLQAFRQELYDEFGNSNIGQAMVLYDAISTFGVRYQRDPQTPFLSVSGDRTIFDSIRYPYELLQEKIGDCDDGTVLLASMLENLDIHTVMLDVFAPGEGHVYLMFDSGVDAEDAGEYFLPNDYVAWEGRAWIPVETTLYGQGDFHTAWRNGVQEYYQRKAEGTVREIDLRAARLVNYPPGRIPSEPTTPPTRAEMLALVQADLQQYATKIRQVVGQPQNNPNSLYDTGAHYLRIGRLTEAMDMMDRALTLDPDFADAHNARGVIYTKMGRYDRANYDRALEAFNTALSLDPSNAGIRLNIAIVYILQGNMDQARQQYNQARQLDPSYQDALRGIIDEP